MGHEDEQRVALVLGGGVRGVGYVLSPNNRLATGLDDHIASAQALAFCIAALFKICDHNSFELIGDLEFGGQRSAHV